MGLWLKQSTSITLQIGPFVDNGDGDTDESGFTIEDGDVLLSKNGAAFAQKHESSNCTYDTAGFYRCPIDGTDTDTLGRLQLDVHVVGALHVYHEFMVVPANTYDSLVGGSDVLTADVTQIGGGAQSATDLKDLADTGYDPATHKVQGLVLCDTTTTNTDMLTLASIADAVLDEVVDTNAPANANSLRETINVIAAVLAGKLSGGGTVNRVFRDLGDTKDRLTAVVDANYNRTSSTPDGT